MPENSNEFGTKCPACGKTILVTAPSALQRPEVGSTDWLGCDLITAERRRQVEQEGWSVEHDNGHDKGQLAMAGAAYAHHATYAGPGNLWPWGMEWWKPGVGRTLDTRIRALAKAGALIAAEIDRLERLRIGDGAQHPNPPVTYPAITPTPK